MQPKLYIDMTLIKILLECTVKENKGNKWATKNLKLGKKGPNPVLPSHCKGTCHLHSAWEGSTFEWELNWGSDPGGICLSCSVAWWCLFWTAFLPFCIQLQQQPAPRLLGATKYSLPCLDTIEKVSEEDFCIICHMSMWKSLLQNDVVPGRWRKDFVDLRSFLNGRSCDFFMLYGFLEICMIVRV